MVNGKPLRKVRQYPYRICFLNDIHVGGQFGLFPEEHTDHYGVTYRPNGGQKILREYMKDYAKQCKEFKSNILFIPGDVLTGQNSKEGGKFVINIELDEQVAAAAKVIAEFVKLVGTIELIYIWKSTGYHGSRDMSVDEAVARKLVADYGLPVEFRGEYSFVDLEYKGLHKKLFITHTASGATMYPEQAMGKDMMLWQEAVGQKKLPEVHMIIRAHKHFFAEVHKSTIRSLQLPCWQFHVPYDKAIQNFARWQPDIGGVVMLFDEKMRTHVLHFLYPNVQSPERFLNIKHKSGVKRAFLSRK